MQDIYKYKPETNHVCIVHIAVVFLKSQFPLRVMVIRMLNVLYLYISTFQYMCAVPNMVVSFTFIIIIIICYHLYTQYLQWRTWNKPC
jgi:hypothetical protein